MLNYFLGLFSHDMGIDLGTANTLVLVKGKGVVVREPSVVAQHRKTKQVLAVGSEAKKMLGKTPATISAFRPLKDGVIADFDATTAMLTYYIKKIHESPQSWMPKIPRPQVVVGIPSGVTEVERRAVQEVCLSAGARKAYLIEEAMAAAIAAGLPIEEPSGGIIVDIGGGTTEMAVISLGGIVLNRSLRVAGDEMNEAIINFLRLKYGFLLGERSAEEAKIQIGSAASVRGKIDKGGDGEKREKVAIVRGRDLETGLPKSLKITEGEIREALAPVVNVIIEALSEMIEQTPPEILGDILEKGIILCGGGSQLRGIDKLIAETIKIPVWIADDPMTCVVRGCGKVLEDKSLLEKVRVTGGLR
ncbi:rod shape-determining protein [Candidatus Microgenomates bacterium]|nr:rod shape-determining protein [Candidatus Microgenomates bacterium]